MWSIDRQIGNNENYLVEIKEPFLSNGRFYESYIQILGKTLSKAHNFKFSVSCTSLRRIESTTMNCMCIVWMCNLLQSDFANNFKFYTSWGDLKSCNLCLHHRQKKFFPTFFPSIWRWYESKNKILNRPILATLESKKNPHTLGKMKKRFRKRASVISSRW